MDLFRLSILYQFQHQYDIKRYLAIETLLELQLLHHKRYRYSYIKRGS